MLPDILLIIFLVSSVYTDIGYRKIYNFLTAPTIISGFLINTLLYGMNGLKQSLLGGFTGFIFLFLFFIIGGVGAGDVKFIVAVGCIKGWEFTFIGGIYGAIIAGIFSIILLLINKKFLFTIKKIYNFFVLFFTFRVNIPIASENSIKLPYAVFLAIGMLIHLIEIQFYR